MREFFNILQRNSLFLRPQKCTFKVEEIDFLGLQLTHHGITIDLAKVLAIKDWPQNLWNLKELYKILGVLGYQHPFILNFVAIARPLMTLLKKDTPFIWTEDCTASLETLIEVITSHPVLVAPNQDWQFELEVDASQFALGAILWQWDPANTKKLQAVGYFSSTLNLAERNYKIYDQELLAIIHTLWHWSHLLRETLPNLPIIIWTDHKNLMYWAMPKKVDPCAATWQVELQQYNLELHHKLGEQNKADALSHWPDYNTGNFNNNHLIILPLD